MAGFGRREIELMQALCIYNRYIECYSVTAMQNNFHLKTTFKVYFESKDMYSIFQL